MKPIAINEANPKSPCIKCANRKVACHSTCELYKEYRDKLDSLPKKTYVSDSSGWIYARGRK